MDLLQLLVRDVQTQPPLRIRLDDVTEFPSYGIGWNRALQLADEPRRKRSLYQPAENTADADIHFQNIQRVPAVPAGGFVSVAMAVTVPVAVFVMDLECNVIHPDHLAAIDVDDLLIQEIPPDAQHVLVGMVGGEHFLAQADAIEGNRGYLVVAHRQPNPAAAHQKPVDAGRMH